MGVSRARRSSAPAILFRTNNGPSKRKCWTDERIVAVITAVKNGMLVKRAAEEEASKTSNICELVVSTDSRQEGTSSSWEPPSKKLRRPLRQAFADSQIDEDTCCICFGSYSKMVMGVSGSSVNVVVGYTRSAQMIVLLIVMEKKDFVTIALKSTSFLKSCYSLNFVYCQCLCISVELLNIVTLCYFIPLCSI